MGAAIYVSFEKEVAGVDASSVPGKGLAGAIDDLDAAATANGLPLLSGFISVSAEEVAAMAEDLGHDVIDAPEEQWFDAKDGLRVVDGLLAHARTVKALSGAVEDLENVARVLHAAAAAGTRFHLSIDI